MSPYPPSPLAPRRGVGVGGHQAMVLSRDAPPESENEDLGKRECPPHSAQQIRRPQAMGWTEKRSLVLGRPSLHDSAAFQGELPRKKAHSKKKARTQKRQSEIRVAVASRKSGESVRKQF